jgi:hypothetical protein
MAKKRLARRVSGPKPIASFDPKKNQFVPKEIFREKEDRAFVRREQDFFNPKKPMSKQEYQSRRLWLRETAETAEDQKNLKRDQERLKRNYEKAKAKKAVAKKIVSKSKKK